MKNKYTEEQFEFIKNNVVNPEKKLVEMFNKKFDIKITVGILGNIKSKLGIKSGLIGGRFQKGIIPYTKGKKWNEFMSEKGQQNCSKTWFKKGRISLNHRPVGSERINVYGYIEVKIEEPNKWKLKHRIIYEKANGKIPKKSKIIFLDGNKTNVNLDNLELITNEQSLIMNQKQYFTKNKSLTKSGVIISSLISKTRKLSQGASNVIKNKR